MGYLDEQDTEDEGDTDPSDLAYEGRAPPRIPRTPTSPSWRRRGWLRRAIFGLDSREQAQQDAYEQNVWAAQKNYENAQKAYQASRELAAYKMQLAAERAARQQYDRMYGTPAERRTEAIREEREARAREVDAAKAHESYEKSLANLQRAHDEYDDVHDRIEALGKEPVDSTEVERLRKSLIDAKERVLDAHQKLLQYKDELLDLHPEDIESEQPKIREKIRKAQEEEGDALTAEEGLQKEIPAAQQKAEDARAKEMAHLHELAVRAQRNIDASKAASEAALKLEKVYDEPVRQFPPGQIGDTRMGDPSSTPSYMPAVPRPGPGAGGMTPGPQGMPQQNTQPQQQGLPLAGMGLAIKGDKTTFTMPTQQFMQRAAGMLGQARQRAQGGPPQMPGGNFGGAPQGMPATLQPMQGGGPVPITNSIYDPRTGQFTGQTGVDWYRQRMAGRAPPNPTEPPGGGATLGGSSAPMPPPRPMGTGIPAAPPVPPPRPAGIGGGSVPAVPFVGRGQKPHTAQESQEQQPSQNTPQGTQQQPPTQPQPMSAQLKQNVFRQGMQALASGKSLDEIEQHLHDLGITDEEILSFARKLGWKGDRGTSNPKQGVAPGQGATPKPMSMLDRDMTPSKLFPAAANQVADASGQIVPIGLRHNNPFDISVTPGQASKLGARIVGAPGQPGFASFGTMQEGLRHGMDRLSRFVSSGRDTIAKMNAGPGGYATDQNWKYGVARASGIPVDAKLNPDDPAQMSALAHGVLTQELGPQAARRVMEGATPATGGGLASPRGPVGPATPPGPPEMATPGGPPAYGTGSGIRESGTAQEDGSGEPAQQHPIRPEERAPVDTSLDEWIRGKIAQLPRTSDVIAQLRTRRKKLLDPAKKMRAAAEDRLARRVSNG